MAREKYKTLTEQMFYILICLRKECCGIDIMQMVQSMTEGRVQLVQERCMRCWQIL